LSIAGPANSRGGSVFAAATAGKTIAMTLSAHERELLAWLDSQHPAMVDLLATLVETDSGSYDKAGVDRVGDLIRTHLIARGIASEVIDCGPAAGYCLKAGAPGPAGAVGRPHVLLLGHRDTVFPAGEAVRRPFRVEGQRAYGPGVADMKAGLVMNTFVLEAFARFGGQRHPVVALYTSDEEIASRASRPVIEAAARGARAVFNAEPGRVTGNVVTGRKGAMFLTIEATGKAVHSGVAHEQGISAIESLCRTVQALHALTDYETGTTVNVGLIQGGQSINTVAPHASARVDVRYRTMRALAEVEAAIEAIVRAPQIPGAATAITDRATFLPLEPTPASRALFEHYVAAAGALGMAVGGEYTGGSADSGFTSAQGVPTLCATGPIGEKAHAPDEVCHLDSMVPRAQALALAILRLD
jgi:glutamate carboxypeptidase